MSVKTTKGVGGGFSPPPRPRRALRYFLLPPNLAYIWLVPAPGGLLASRHDCLQTEKCGKDFVAGFAKDESLYRRILTKYK